MLRTANRVCLFITAYVLLVSCRAYQLDSAQETLRSTFARQDFQKSEDLLTRFGDKEIYRPKDEVLYRLELGTVTHFKGNFEQSNVHFTEAEDRIDQLFTKSVSRAVQSFLLNDNALAYDGEDYEDIYLNIFKALNFIHLEEFEAALVESRRIAFKLQRLNIRYKGLVEALSKADTTGQVDWKTGDTNVQNSALGHYLSAILFAKTNKPDDARIAFQNLLASLRDQPAVYPFSPPLRSELRKVTQPDRYNLLVTAFSGRAPVKVQHDLRLYLDQPDLYLKFSVPSLRMYRSQVSRVEVHVNGDSLHKELYLLEEMDRVAREVYKVKEPIIYARSVVRSYLKAAGTNKISDEIGEKNHFLGGLANFLGKIGQEATEKADLRGWQTMPGKVHAAVLHLPPGTHEIDILYYGAGQLVYSEKRSITVGSQPELELLESLYWN
ncbi:MAG: hypothetical protein R3281_11220 [Balneolaceae bacterium]|nr:hypothetical protein [Balneolaceae bacterium]